MMSGRFLVFILCITTSATVLQAQTLEDIRFGNLHSHTSYSDGSGTPSEAWEMACNEAPDLDFFAITEHNHDKADGKGELKDGLLIASDPSLYRGRPEALVETADRLNRDGECVTIFGQEFSTISSGNHINVFDVGSVIDVPNGRFDRLAAWLDANPDSTNNAPLVQFNHPYSGKKAWRDYGRDDFGEDEARWMREMVPRVSLIEIFNAPALKFGTNQPVHSRHSAFRYWLNLGFHLAPSVGQDNHTRNWGISTDARVAAIAPDFTRRGILDALKRRHAYASEDRNLRILFRIGGALQGDIVPSPPIGSELPITLVLRDDDEPNAWYRVDVYRDSPGGRPASWPVETFEFEGDQTEPIALEGIHLEEEGQYLFLRITQTAPADGEEGAETEHLGEDIAWTAPIWFEDPGFHHAAEHEFALRMIELLPDPAGIDRDGESITFRNDGTERVHLAGWKARDLAGNFWELDPLVSLGPGETKTLLRNRAEMSLNNDGDRVELVAPDGMIVDMVDYGPVERGEVVRR